MMADPGDYTIDRRGKGGKANCDGGKRQGGREAVEAFGQAEKCE